MPLQPALSRRYASLNSVHTFKSSRSMNQQEDLLAVNYLIDEQRNQKCEPVHTLFS